jgi:hypothetical protein
MRPARKGNATAADPVHGSVAHPTEAGFSTAP